MVRLWLWLWLWPRLRLWRVRGGGRGRAWYQALKMAPIVRGCSECWRAGVASELVVGVVVEVVVVVVGQWLCNAVNAASKPLLG